jgi:hypothetical protein
MHHASLTSSQAGAAIGLSRKRIWYYVDTGELTADRIGPGKTIRIHIPDLVRFALRMNYVAALQNNLLALDAELSAAITSELARQKEKETAPQP